MEHLHHYVFGHHFTIHTDHSPLVNLFQKCLNDTSPCLLHLLLRLSQYQMDVKYVTHKCVPVVDCMSCLIDITSDKDDPSLNLQIADLGVDTNVQVDWNEIRKSCMNDPMMVRLARVLQQGWPESGKDLPNDVKVYFPYRFELHIVN